MNIFLLFCEEHFDIWTDYLAAKLADGAFIGPNQRKLQNMLEEKEDCKESMKYTTVNKWLTRSLFSDSKLLFFFITGAITILKSLGFKLL